MSKKIYDPIHGYMDIDPYALAVIDSIPFKRLRQIKQLGTCYEVFPGASHNRFEHSIGVYHLSNKMIDSLNHKSKQAAAVIDPKQAQLISIAALAHDLGHGPYSHIFDNELIPLYQSTNGLQPTIYNEHEVRSGMLIEHILEDINKRGKLDFKITGYDIDFIQRIIHPQEGDKNYLFQIVANDMNGIDVDKLDYIQRDICNIGLNYSYDYDRIINDAKVIDGNICYPSKIRYQIFDMFYTRYRLHKEVYNHPVAKSVEYMVRDILLESEEYLGLAKSINTLDFIKYTDNILPQIWNSSEPGLENARSLYKRIQERDLYKYLGEIKYTHGEIDRDFLIDFVSESVEKDQFIVQDMHIGFSNTNENPLNNVLFYHSKTPEISFQINPDNLTKILPSSYEERTLRVFAKNKESQSSLSQKCGSLDGFLLNP